MMLVSLQLFQLTSGTVSRPALRRALNALVEGDAVIARNYDDLRARAEAAAPGETLLLRDYPIDVPLTREEVLSSTPETVRTVLLERATERLYADGTGVLRGEGGDSSGRFTAAGVVDESLGFLRSGVHAILGVVTLVLAGISVCIAAALVALCRGFGRLVALGATALVAAIPVLVGGLALWGYTNAAAGSDEYLRAELMGVAASLAVLPVRNGAALCVLGVTTLILGIAGARLSGRAEPIA
jgi:hypothetical protein